MAAEKEVLGNGYQVLNCHVQALSSLVCLFSNLMFLHIKHFKTSVVGSTKSYQQERRIKKTGT